VFGGSNGDDITQPYDPIALGEPEQIPAWVEIATEVIRYTGSKAGTAQSVQTNVSNSLIQVIGFSAGADAAIMFADNYISTNVGCGRISDVASLGGTLSGTMIDGSSLAETHIWTAVFNRLLDNGIDIYALNDSAAGGNESSSYQPPVNASGSFIYVDRPTQEHWQGGFPGTGTNNSRTFRQEVLDWFNSN
jgi:hypothetical protein